MNRLPGAVYVLLAVILFLGILFLLGVNLHVATH
jgi:hypothetical protein